MRHGQPQSGRLGKTTKITNMQNKVLAHIGHAPGISQAKLVKMMSTSKQYMSQVIKRLVELGLVETKVPFSDGRALGLYLTELGKKQQAQWRAESAKRTEALLKDLTEEERARFFGAFCDLNRLLPKLIGDTGVLF